jgi:hypothetical protein
VLLVLLACLTSTWGVVQLSGEFRHILAAPDLRNWYPLCFCCVLQLYCDVLQWFISSWDGSPCFSFLFFVRVCACVRTAIMRSTFDSLAEDEDFVMFNHRGRTLQNAAAVSSNDAKSQ